MQAVLENAGAPINWNSGDQDFPLVREREIQKFKKLNDIIAAKNGFAELNAQQFRDLFPKVEKPRRDRGDFI